MRNFSAIKTLTNNQTTLNFPVQNLADNRVEALKSLVILVMRELESLQKLTSKNKDSQENKNISLHEEVEDFEIELIRTALIQSRGHQANAAKLLGIKTTTLNAKMKRYSIDPRAFLI